MEPAAATRDWREGQACFIIARLVFFRSPKQCLAAGTVPSRSLLAYADAEDSGPDPEIHVQ
jgi:hypothetical protein